MTKAYMVIDLQYGSTGKGLLAGFLANHNKPDVVVTAWGPNAGHTYIDANGREYIHRMLANGVVSPNLETVLIGPNSVLDMDCLLREVISCKDLLKDKEIIIHPAAVVVTQEHREIEARNIKIGSTMKGTGAAVISRIERDPDHNPTAEKCVSRYFLNSLSKMGIGVAVSSDIYRERLRTARVMQIEGAQGYSLSMYHGFYPYTTSRDVTPAQVMADCAVPLSIRPKVYGTLRTYPIRVANRFAKDGTQIGTSGPCYRDQVELDWADIGVEPELTTVTKLPRRVFSFSMEQTREAIFQCAPDMLFLNFANYLTPTSANHLIKEINAINPSQCRVQYVGVGPKHEDVESTVHWMYKRRHEIEEYMI